MPYYRVYYAQNWPDALMDKNTAANWPTDYNYAGAFRAAGLEDLWALLNRDNRPNARQARSMCVGDIAVEVRPGRPSPAWMVRMLGWKKLRLAPRRKLNRRPCRRIRARTKKTRASEQRSAGRLLP